jgi:hypothetical protein
MANIPAGETYIAGFSDDDAVAYLGAHGLSRAHIERNAEKISIVWFSGGNRNSVDFPYANLNTGLVQHAQLSEMHLAAAVLNGGDPTTIPHLAAARAPTAALQTARTAVLASAATSKRSTK